MADRSGWRRRVAASGWRLAERVARKMQVAGKGRATGPVEVRFQGAAAGRFPAGTTLLEAARSLGVDLDHYCGGNCSCGTCRVEVVRGGEHLARMRSSEAMVLGHEAVRAGDRLACQARVLGPVEVRVPAFFMVRGS